MRALFLALILAAFTLTARAEADTVLRVDFSNPGLTPSQWTLEFHPDGTGHFRSQRGSAPKDDPRLMEVANIDRDVQVSPKFAERAFQVAQHKKFFQVADCESHLKVAFQGTKKLTYSGPQGRGVVRVQLFARRRDPGISGDSLVAVATTIIEGARLEKLLQHDPLGLDKEIQNVQEAAGDGRAQQICSIRDILERLSEDPAVLERVRKTSQGAAGARRSVKNVNSDGRSVARRDFSPGDRVLWMLRRNRVTGTWRSEGVDPMKRERKQDPAVGRISGVAALVWGIVLLAPNMRADDEGDAGFSTGGARRAPELRRRGSASLPGRPDGGRPGAGQHAAVRGRPHRYRERRTGGDPV